MDMGKLCDDLLAETADLEALVVALDTGGWATSTPAEGWDVKDQVAHLAYFDDRARQAMTDADGFRADLEEALRLPDLVDSITEDNRRHDGDETLAWFRRARADLVAVARTADPSTRVPWYGPDMSVASSITARIMETWAHGQDVADALGAVRAPTDRLRHVAFIGVRTLANSYQARGLEVPDVPVRVELRAPSGEAWLFGPDDAVDVVRGPALDFCLAVTQRRHIDDLDIDVEGPVAAEWLSIAQAFAGPPGSGRRPGQFAR
ncbi:MAG: wyosine base formation protein [Acidimicrobiales bacterium]|nr:wyosine base formation protein [Acidimicrobiales bacterium]